MIRNSSISVGTGRTTLGRGRPLGLKILWSVAFIAPQVAAAAPAAGSWESPFQAGRPDMLRDKLKPLPASRCSGDPYNKCTFSAHVDYDGDGTSDTVQMVNGVSVGAIVVVFGGKAKRRPLTIASFNGPWTGSCYIEAAPRDRRAVAFICPESSAAVFKMHEGRPAARWAAD